MKATVSRILFGLLLGLVGGICFGLLARAVVQGILRSDYNSYYAESGSNLPTLGMILIGLVTGILVPLINKRLLRPVVGAGVWTLGTLVYLFLPFAYSTLLIPFPVIGACSLISLLGGAVLGGIAAWVDLP